MWKKTAGSETVVVKEKHDKNSSVFIFSIDMAHTWAITNCSIQIYFDPHISREIDCL